MHRCILAILSLAFCAGAQAVSEDVQLNLVTPQGVGQSIGSVKITETDRGLEFAPELRALPPGKHGFHIHAEGSCQPAMKEGKAVAAGAAGGHYDPQHTGKHEGPLGTGHLGDLPLLVVNDAGVADQPIIGSGKIERVRSAIVAEKLSMTRQQWFRIRKAALGYDVP